MPSIMEIRQKYPQYQDMDDESLAGALHKKFYSDMPEVDFRAKIGLPLNSPQQRIAGAFDAASTVEQRPPPTAYQGAILPMSRDTQGGVHFDSNAGLLGAAKRAFTLPGDVLSGKQPVYSANLDTGDVSTDPGLESRAKELAAMTLPVNPAFRAGDRAIPGVARQALRREEPKVPTADELRTAGAQGFERARNMGVDYDAGAVAQLASTARAGLENDGILPILAPKSFSILKQLETPPPKSIAQISGIHAARRALNNAAKDFANPTEQLAAKRIIEELDRFVKEPDPASVVAGPAAAAGATQAEAIGNYAAAMRSRELSGRQNSAERRAKASNSGRNIDNTLRQRVASLLDQIDKGQMRGYSAEEVKAMNEFVAGKSGRNTARLIANILGGGGGFGTAVTGLAGLGAGGYALGPAGAAAGVALPMVGWGAKTAQNALGRRAMTKVDEQVRSRSPLYAQMQANAPVQPISPAKRAALLRAMMLYGPGALGPPPQSGGGGY